MPKRNRDQQDKHNESRRRITAYGKKAIFSVQYIKTKQPELVEEAGKIYDFLFEFYPRKHDLAKTDMYKQCMNNNALKKRILAASPTVRNTSEGIELQPVLNIPLLQIPTSSTSTPLPDQTTTVEEIPASSTSTPLPDQTTIVEEIPSETPILTDEETTTLIRDLQQDPDLMEYFQDVLMNEVSIRTEKPYVESTTLKDEIEQIIQEQFEALGKDLPDIPVNDEQFFSDA